MTSSVHIETIDGSWIVLDVDGEVYIEVDVNGMVQRHAAWPKFDTLKEIKEWAESRIDHAEKPLREARDQWAQKFYESNYEDLETAWDRDIVDKVLAEIAPELNSRPLTP